MTYHLQKQITMMKYHSDFFRILTQSTNPHTPSPPYRGAGVWMVAHMRAARAHTQLANIMKFIFIKRND